MPQQPAKGERHDICAESPSPSGVSDDERQVGHILNHDAALDVLRAETDLLPVDRHCAAACKQHFQTCLRNVLGCVGDYIRFSCAETLVEIPIGTETKSLVPRVVSWCECGLSGICSGSCPSAARYNSQRPNAGKLLVTRNSEPRGYHTNMREIQFANGMRCIPGFSPGFLVLAFTPSLGFLFP